MSSVELNTRWRIPEACGELTASWALRDVNISVFSSVNTETKTPRCEDSSPVQRRLCPPTLRDGYQPSHSVCLLGDFGWILQKAAASRLSSQRCYQNTPGLLKGSAVTASLRSAGNIVFTGGGVDKALGFESDLYIHHLRGKHPHLTKTTHMHKHSLLHGHARTRRKRCVRRDSRTRPEHAKHLQRSETVVSEACWAVCVCVCDKEQTQTHTLPLAQITCHEPQNWSDWPMHPPTPEAMLSWLIPAGSHAAAWVSAHLDSASMWVRLSAGCGQVRSSGHSTTSTR